LFVYFIGEIQCLRMNYKFSKPNAGTTR
jgi:hypothetical protein